MRFIDSQSKSIYRMSRTHEWAVPPDFLFRGTYELTLRTLPLPTKLYGRLLRVNAYLHSTLPTPVIATLMII